MDLDAGSNDQSAWLAGVRKSLVTPRHQTYTKHLWGPPSHAHICHHVIALQHSERAEKVMTVMSQ